MADDSRDVLMKIVLNGSAIPSECAAVVNSKETLASGFTYSGPGKTNYFALKDFRLNVGIISPSSTEGSDPNTSAQLQAMSKQMEENNKKMMEMIKQHQTEMGKNVQGGTPLPSAKSANEYSRFMSNGRSALRAKSYLSNLDKVTITKMMDASSLTLFKACINSTTLDSAVIIKRRGGGANTLRTYLRIEFTNLLITDFNWKEDDVISEDLNFVCRKAEIKYSVENDDGSLKPPGAPRTWSVLNATG